MTIDTKRLATDAAYWHKCGAPNDVTHYCELAKSFLIADDDCICTKCIPRPTKPDAPEWVEYPSGTGKLIVSEPDNNGVVIVLDEGGEYRRVAKDNIKPLRTAEQRQREELIDLISHHPIYKNAVNTLADDILSRYNLEPKP